MPQLNQTAAVWPHVEKVLWLEDFAEGNKVRLNEKLSDKKKSCNLQHNVVKKLSVKVLDTIIQNWSDWLMENLHAIFKQPTSESLL